MDKFQENPTEFFQDFQKIFDVLTSGKKGLQEFVT